MTRRDAALFVGLSAIWGSSFMFIKLGLQGGFHPLTLVTLRLLFGSLVMLALLWRQGLSFPRERRLLISIAILAFFNNVIPFTLITWGEQFITSSLTAILNSSVPLFAVLLSHLALSDERLTFRRGGGVLLGFAGVLVLFVPDLLLQSGGNRLAGEIAIIIASMGYAIGSVFARKRLHGVPAAVLSTSQISLAFLWMLLPALLIEQPWTLRPTPIAWFSALWLGVLGTGLAYLLYFSLLKNIGATPTTMVTYVIPLFAVTYSVIFLSEPLHWSQILAMTLIFLGVWLANRR